MWQTIVWNMKCGFYVMCGMFALTSFLAVRAAKREPSKAMSLAGILWRMIFKK